jgi:hypothetical protein
MRATKQRRVPRALIRPAHWFCLCNLLAAALSAQCTKPTPVASGTYTSGDHSQVDDNALSASNFAVSGGASATFSAGNCIQLNPGFHASAIGATVPTTFHAWVDIAPTAVSVVPSSPPQNPPLSQSFTWTVSSPAGHSNLSHVFALFSGTSTSTTNACYVHYDASSNLVYLADNTSTTWLGGFAPSSSGSIGNSQCTIYGTASSPNPTSSGTQLGLTLTVAFQSSFAGTRNEYLYALDSSGVYTGWQQMGTWTVPAPPAPDFILTAATDSYYAQTGSSTPSYTLTVTPQSGFNSPVSFSVAWPMYGCLNATFSPSVVAGSPWTTTATMSCYETLQNTYWTTVTASGGGKSHQLNLYLYVSPSQQYFLSTAVSPPGAGNIYPASGWYNAGTQATVTASANAGYQFTGFSGSLAGGSPGYVIMNSNKSVTANFTQTAITQTITSVPTGLSLTVDGGACTAPCVRQWQAGTNHTIAAATQSGGSGTQYLFSSWSDNGASTHTITAPSSSATYSATFATQYFLTTSSASGGAISPAPPGAWYNAGAQVQVSATTANSGYQFSGFSGALTGTVTPQWLTLSGPLTVNANFTSVTAPDFTITVSPPQTMPSGQLLSAIPVTITPLNGFSSPVDFTWTNTSSWPTDLTANFTQNPATGSTNVSIGSSERTPAGHYSLQFSAAGGGNIHSAEVEIPIPDIHLVQLRFGRVGYWRRLCVFRNLGDRCGCSRCRESIAGGEAIAQWKSDLPNHHCPHRIRK